MFGYINNDTTKEKSAPFGYRDESDYPAVVTLKNADNTTFGDLNYSIEQGKQGVPKIVNFSSYNEYHEIRFWTRTNKPDPFSFRMIAPSYLTKTVTAGRFIGKIGNWNSTAVAFKDLNNKTEASFTYKDNFKSKISFDRTVKAESGNLVLPKTKEGTE